MSNIFLLSPSVIILTSPKYPTHDNYKFPIDASPACAPSPPHASADTVIPQLSNVTPAPSLLSADPILQPVDTSPSQTSSDQDLDTITPPPIPESAPTGRGHSRQTVHPPQYLKDYRIDF